jgi:hypothetical protein
LCPSDAIDCPALKKQVGSHTGVAESAGISRAMVWTGFPLAFPGTGSIAPRHLKASPQHKCLNRQAITITARQSLINIVWRLITSGSLGHETNV